MNLLYRFYFFLPDFSRIGIIGKAINKGLELLLIFTLNNWVPFYFRRISPGRLSGLNSEPRDRKFIISLTSFPARIEKVWIVIECLLRQSFKPDQIILWLADEQFPGRVLPNSLLKLCQRGLTISFCEDIKSHKKYYYTMKNFKEDIVITFDDDVFYPSNILEQLVITHCKFPDAVVANFAHKVGFSSEGKILPYMRWRHKYKGFKSPSHLLLQVGVGGVLYPPGVLYKDVFNKDLIEKLCPKSDDVWLKTMSYLAKTPVVTNTLYNKQLAIVANTQSESLVSTNSKKGQKDLMIKEVINHYHMCFTNCI